MKRLIVFLLAMVFLFALTACDTTGTTTVTEPSSAPDPIPEGPYVKYSPYALNAYVREAIGEDYAIYCDLVDAVLNYECEISGFRDENQFISLWSTLRDEFLPAKALCANWGNSSQPYTYSDGTVQLEFLFPQQEHNQLLDAYAEKIQSDLSILTEEDTEASSISKLYHRVVEEMSYVEAFGVQWENIQSGQGDCEVYAKYLMILLEQIGVECYYAMGHGEDVIGHAWVIAKMDEQFYHFDPTWQEDFMENFWFGIEDDLRKASLLNVWKFTFLSGGNWESISGDEVTLEGKICWITNEKIPLPPCPTAYSQNER